MLKRKNVRNILTLLALCFLLLVTACAKTETPAATKPANPDLILATTTSTQDSGLLDALLPVFEKKTGYKVKTVAVGTGQALALGEKGEADVLLVHAPDAEKKVVAGGSAIERKLVMHNDFILLGAVEDIARVKGNKIDAALKAIAEKKAAFISRGDDSGTHKMEQALWKKAGVAAKGNAWYQEAGAGMGQTLKIADEKKAYTLSDRATFLAQQKNMTLGILLEGDPALLNIYHVMEVNPEKFAKVNAAGAKAFSEFLLSQEGQQMIATFGKDKYGQALFFADGGKSDQDLGLQ
ncbi:substrate-binding domain-containing protein [Azotosporobacter soli]|uniref:substrate-binding domain-containing protein n=1 Tax=Azotosporobacter soli TaxID=3055040 RepID=UPI0031FE7EE7